ncbi:MAG: hypothetical protein GF320_10715 [Armatimonadia bacterium]|nr:hypothetical protein [Armatimonadia bacterium]
MVGTLPRLNEYVIGEQWRFAWEDPGQKEAYRSAVHAEVRRMGNHPSIVMWAQSANFFGRYQDQAPSTIGRRGFYEYDDKARAGLEGVEIARSIDPTRPIFNHHGADIGDLHTCNNYLCLIPLQEREEWLSTYVEGADIPFLPIEFGTPLAPTFMRGRNGFGPAISSEPLATEFAAIYLGSEAYELETQAYRDAIASRHQGGMSYQSWHGHPDLDGAPPMQAVIELFLENTWHSWRTWPLSAGMVPWSLAHGWHNPPEGRYAETDYEVIPGARGARPQRVRTREMRHYDPESGWEVRPSGRALMEVSRPTLAYIAGAPEHFTDKDHHYIGGEQISKQVVLINDSRDTLPYSYELRVATPLEFEGSSGSGELAPAEILRIPWVEVAPTVDAVTDAAITLTATIGEAEHTDEFDLRLYPQPQPTLTESVVLLYDPEGETTALLSELGYASEPWDGQPSPGRVLIIGRDATADFAALPGSIAEHVRAGGRAVIFSQKPDVLRDAQGLRVARHVSRRAFVVPTMTDHPIAEGLDPADLRDWRGSGTSVAETWGGPEELSTVNPPYGWHWGNRGSVSGGMFEKPHHSGWRPLLEGEFDLAYTPLMELSFGEGYAMLCQLDLEARTDTDPVARELARRMVDHALTVVPDPRAESTVYLGGPQGEAALFRIGLVYESVDSLPDSGLAVLGEEHGVSDDALRTFLAAGGRALILPLNEELPLGLTTTATATPGSLLPPMWREARGLSASDLRLRVDVELPLLAGTDGAEIGADGLLARIAEGEGSAVAIAALPDHLDTRRRMYLRYSAWRLERTLCQILANLGAEFEMDEKSLTPGWNMEFVPIGIAGEWRFQVEHKLPATDDPGNRPEDPGMTGTDEGWHLPDYDDSDWARVEVPGAWEDWPGVGEAEGSFWLRRWVQIPETWEGEELMLQLGSIDDHDVTYFNGVQVGAMEDFSAERAYQIPAGLVSSGPNLIAVRVFDNYGGGGVYASAGQMRIGRVAPIRLPAGQEILINTTFEDELEGWDANFMGDAQGAAELTTDAPGELMGARSVRFQVDQPSDTSWHANFAQKGFGIEAGTQYVYSFWAKASEPCTITAAIEKDHPPYGGAGFWEHVNLTPEWQHFEFDFIPEVSDSQTRFVFQELARQPVIYHFCRPSFRIKDTGAEPDPDALAGFYHPDYLKGHDLGDDPYRYHRW